MYFNDCQFNIMQYNYESVHYKRNCHMYHKACNPNAELNACYIFLAGALCAPSMQVIALLVSFYTDFLCARDLVTGQVCLAQTLKPYSECRQTDTMYIQRESMYILPSTCMSVCMLRTMCIYYACVEFVWLIVLLCA